MSGVIGQEISSYGPRAMIAGDLYGETVPAIALEFKPTENIHARTIHGLTHAEVTHVLYPDNPEKHSTLTNTRCFNVSGPFGNLHGYIDVEAFDAVCRALGVQP